eukprot:scaffold84527_cov67-Phaeocystis_antarctica.AAC.1
MELKPACEKDSLRATLTIYGVDEGGGEDGEDRLAGEANEGEVKRRPRERHLQRDPGGAVEAPDHEPNPAHDLRQQQQPHRTRCPSQICELRRKHAS